jgi:hypothetical protein
VKEGKLSIWLQNDILERSSVQYYNDNFVTYRIFLHPNCSFHKLTARFTIRHHHTSHLDSSSLHLQSTLPLLYTPPQPQCPPPNVTRRHHHLAPSHGSRPDGAHHRQHPRAAHRSRAGDLPALCAQAKRERAGSAESLHGVRGPRRQQGSQEAARRPHRPQDGCALQEELGGVPSGGERGYAGVGLAR